MTYREKYNALKREHEDLLVKYNTLLHDYNTKLEEKNNQLEEKLTHIIETVNLIKNSFPVTINLSIIVTSVFISLARWGHPLHSTTG